MSENESPEFVPRFDHFMGDNFTNLRQFAIQSKMPYVTTVESQVAKLKLTMEMYKDLMLQINNFLLWKKSWNWSAIIGGSTVVFMLIWLSEPSTLTLISMIGLILTLGDYILPIIVSTLFKNEDWNREKQQQYEEICTNLIIYRTKFELLLTSFYRMRVTNPVLYFSVTIFGLAILAWLGNTINNLFLSYITTLLILLVPGMVHNGMLNKPSETWSRIFTDLVENAKSKISQKKIIMSLLNNGYLEL